MRYVPAADRNYNVKFPRIGDYLTGLFDSQSPTYLMTVADLSRLVVNMQINEMDVLKLSPGLPVTVTVDALEGASFAARVSLISPQAEKNNAGLKVFKVEVELDRVGHGGIVANFSAPRGDMRAPRPGHQQSRP